MIFNRYWVVGSIDLAVADSAPYATTYGKRRLSEITIRII